MFKSVQQPCVLYLDISQVIISDRLDQLGDVEEHGLGRVGVEHPGGVLGRDRVDRQGALAWERECAVLQYCSLQRADNCAQYLQKSERALRGEQGAQVRRWGSSGLSFSWGEVSGARYRWWPEAVSGPDMYSGHKQCQGLICMVARDSVSGHMAPYSVSKADSSGQPRPVQLTSISSERK